MVQSLLLAFGHAGDATALSNAILDALAADAARVGTGLGDVAGFSQLVANAIAQAQVPQDTEVTALGRALAQILQNCGTTSSCSSGAVGRFASVTQAGFVLRIAVAAGLQGRFGDIFTEVIIQLGTCSAQHQKLQLQLLHLSSAASLCMPGDQLWR